MKKRLYLSGLLVLGLIFSSVMAKATGIISDPRDTTVCAASTTWFIMKNNDTGTVARKWLLSTNGGSSWSIITANSTYSGVTTDTLKVVATMALDGYMYKGVATNPAGSDTSAAATLHVQSASTDAITGPSSVCAGNIISLSNATAGGTWSVSNDSGTVTTTGVFTGVLANGLLPGADTVMYTTVNACGTTVMTKVITINPTPTAGTIIGANAICAGSTTSLTDATTGGVWSSVTPSIATVNASGMVFGHAQGIDVIRYTTTLGPCTAVASHTVRVDTAVVALPITGPTSTCRGGFITLMNGNTLGNGVWSSTSTTVSVNASTGVVTGVAYGPATIDYNFSNTCNSASSSTTIQVDTLLNHGTISGPSIVCAGSWIHLTETLNTGIWLSSNSGVANVDPSGNVTGISQGAATISYLLSNACGASVATHSVTVAQGASAITGIDSVGVGLTRAMGNAVAGGTWSVDNSNIATVDPTTGVVTGVTVGNTNLSYTVTNVCGTTTATVIFYVGNAPSAGSITGANSVCVGSTITLSTDVAGGVWTASNNRATVSSTGDVTGVSSLLDTARVFVDPVHGPHLDTFSGKAISFDTIRYTVTNAFGSSTITKRIFVDRTPRVEILGPSVVALGGNYFFLGLPQGGTFTNTNSTMGQFISFTPDIVLNTGTNHPVDATMASYVLLRAGTDNIHYRYTNDCGTVDSVFTIRLTPAGVVTLGGNSGTLRVFPNPNNGSFIMDLASDLNEEVTVTVTNMVGAKVKEFTAQTNQQSNVSLDQQPAGIYLITATTANGNYSAKVTLTK